MFDGRRGLLFLVFSRGLSSTSFLREEQGYILMDGIRNMADELDRTREQRCSLVRLLTGLGSVMTSHLHFVTSFSSVCPASKDCLAQVLHPSFLVIVCWQSWVIVACLLDEIFFYSLLYVDFTITLTT